MSTKSIELSAVEALNRLNEIAISFFLSQTFFTACQLGIFEQLGDGSVELDELAARIKLRADVCTKLLAALQQMGLVECRDGKFRNSPVALFLTSKSPVPLEALSMWGTPFYHMWEFLPDALREVSPRWQQALGTTTQEAFGALYEDPSRLQRFAQYMNAYSIPIGMEIAELFDFSRYRSLLDIAGGGGGLSIQIGLRYPHLQGIVADLPPVCQVAQEEIKAKGLGDRFVTQPFDLFKAPYPKGTDVVLLSWVLHDWNDENCLTILKNCFDALPSGGALLISEIVLKNDFSGSTFGVLMSLHMAVVMESGARERTEKEYQGLLEKTGFKQMEVVRLNAPRDLIIAHKP